VKRLATLPPINATLQAKAEAAPKSAPPADIRRRTLRDCSTREVLVQLIELNAVCSICRISTRGRRHRLFQGHERNLTDYTVMLHYLVFVQSCVRLSISALSFIQYSMVSLWPLLFGCPCEYIHSGCLFIRMFHGGMRFLQRTETKEAGVRTQGINIMILLLRIDIDSN